MNKQLLRLIKTPLLILFLFGFSIVNLNAQSAQDIINIHCPCFGPTNGGFWNNHGEYVSCVTQSVNQLVADNIIPKNRKGRYISAAASSNCGKNNDDLPDESEQEDSEGTLTVIGIKEKGFNILQPLIQIQVAQANFSNDITDFYWEINGVTQPLDNLILNSNDLSFNANLSNGLNEIFFLGKDANGLALTYNTSIWAGDRSLPVTVIDEGGLPVSGASVKVVLSDSPEILETGTTTGGVIIFPVVPNRTLIVTATTSDNKIANGAVVGTGSGITLQLLSFNPPSSIDNNDISQGTAGWNIGNSFVQVIPHVEGAASSFQNLIANATTNQDLVLNTTTEGPRSISRTFTSDPGAKSISVRFKFVTSEVPGGFFGSRFNDNYSVSIRSLVAGGLIGEQNSMNGLGLGAFDASGATSWREITLPLSESGDVIQVDVTVANVGDGAFDSQVIIDFIEEDQIAITSLDLNDIDEADLEYISLGPHTHYNGNTRIHGTITVEGPESEQLNSLTLEVLSDGNVIATGTLASSVANTLTQAFGEDEKVEISSSQLLFEILGSGSFTSNTSVQLRVKAETSSGESATKEAGSVPIMTSYSNTNRYGGRDENRGGDGWGLPEVLSYTGSLDNSWRIGDISNMNGGSFRPDHKTHRNGVDVDAWFPGYNNRDATTAQTLIDFLNSPLGPRITLIYVTYSKTNTNTFWNAIKDVTLSDGREAKDVITALGNHEKHFHLRIQPNSSAQNQQLASNSANRSQSLRERPNELNNKLENGVAIFPMPISFTNENLTLRADVPNSGDLNIQVFDITGRMVHTIFNKNVSEGELMITWNGKTNSNKALPSGTYFIKFILPGMSETINKKLIIN